MPVIAMCTFGSDATSRAVALVRDECTIVPVSATTKFAPVMPDVGVEEHLAELPARRLRQLLELGRHLAALDAGEELGDVLLRLLDRRRDDVDGVLAAELEDVLAEIGLDRP